MNEVNDLCTGHPTWLGTPIFAQDISEHSIAMPDKSVNVVHSGTYSAIQTEFSISSTSRNHQQLHQNEQISENVIFFYNIEVHGSISFLGLQQARMCCSRKSE
jgi:hypothetical protein